MLKTRAITGQESSILAMLATCQGMSVEDQDRAIKVLRGRSLKRIALCIAGRVPAGATKAERKCAQAFISWGLELAR